MPNPAWHQAGFVPDLELDDPPPSESARWHPINRVERRGGSIAVGLDAPKSDESASHRAKRSAARLFAGREASAMHPSQD